MDEDGLELDEEKSAKAPPGPKHTVVMEHWDDTFNVRPKTYLSDHSIPRVWNYLEEKPIKTYNDLYPTAVYTTTMAELTKVPQQLQTAGHKLRMQQKAAGLTNMAKQLRHAAGGGEWVGIFNCDMNHYIAGKLEQDFTTVATTATAAPGQREYKLTLWDSMQWVNDAALVVAQYREAMGTSKELQGSIKVVKKGLGWQNQEGEERENSCGIYAAWVAYHVTHHQLPLKEPSLDMLALLRCIAQQPTEQQLTDWVTKSRPQLLPNLQTFIEKMNKSHLFLK